MSLPSVMLAWGLIMLPPQPPGRQVGGVVEDTQGGVIVGARVTAICDDLERVTTADGEGRFQIAALPATACVILAASPLFEPATVAVDLAEADATGLRLVLTVASMATELLVTPSRGGPEAAFQVPEAVTVTTREELDARPHQILPQALREEPGVLVQQTTTAQGSPFIRGFSAQRILYLMDGIRFNTSTYRAGATQYLGWVNPALVERLEIVRGPASVQYGSDALGGTVNVLSLSPEPIGTGRRVSGAVEAQLGSADLSGGGDANVLIQTSRAALRVGGSARAVDELRSGRARDSHSAITRFLGLPSTTLYTRLPQTGFRQAGAFAAATVPLGPDAVIKGVYLHEEQLGVQRYDRIIGGDGRHRSEFEPQRLDFGYLQYARGRTGALSSLSAAVSINRQQDDRADQDRPTTRIERQRERVLALGYQAQGTWLAGQRHAVTFGGELYDEYIAAGRAFEDPQSGQLQVARPRIPDGTRYTSSGLFAQTVSDIVPDRLLLRAGLRYGRFVFRMRDDPRFGVGAERVVAQAFTFHTGGVVPLSRAVNATLTISRGFRAANAFDLGAIGISGGGFELAPADARRLGAQVGDSDGVEAAATGQAVMNLTPESAYAFEGGLKFQASRLTGAINVFNVELVDIIQRRTAIFPSEVVGTAVAGFTIVRQDETGRAFVDADPRPIVTRANVDRARVNGFEADAQVRLGREWMLSGLFSLTRGHEVGSGAFLRRMPPPIGGARLRWQSARRPLWIEGVVNFALDQTRLSPGDLRDARIGAVRSRESIAEFFSGTAVDLGLVDDARLTITGETLEQVQDRVLGRAQLAPMFAKTPGFVVAGARAGWRLGSNLEMTVLADNLTDRNYRWHGSGVDAPGFNVQVRTRFRF